PYEIRVLHLGAAGLRIDAVEVTALNGAADEMPPPARWRLGGRLRGSGPRGPDAALVVRRDELPGAVLASVRPRPRLAPGEYRLSVGATAANPRDAAQPVLGLEISALLARAAAEPLLSRRTLPLLSRDFTAAELAEGRVEAAVPLPAAALAG